MARLLLLTNRIIDDRGQRTRWRSATYSSGLTKAEEHQSPWIAAYKRELAREMMRRKPWVLPLAFTPVIVIAIAVMIAAYEPGDFGHFILGGVICIVFLYGMFVLLRSLRFGIRRDLDILSSLPPDCPSCEHALDGLPIADDGCTICPECGCAWDLRQYRSPID